MRPPARTVDYGTGQQLDIYRAKGGSSDSIVLLHGGGFVFGNRRMRAMRTLIAPLLDAGISVVAPDYRNLFRGGESFSDALDDTLAALDWWRDQCAAYDLDPGRVSVGGLSSGAALATVAAASRPVRSVVGVYGPYDFTRLPGRRAAPVLARLLVRSADPRRWKHRSPCNVCTTPAPVLLLQGDADRLIGIHHLYALAEMRKSRGLPVRAHIYPGVGHGFFNFPGLAVVDDAVGDLVSFLLEPR